MLKLVSFRAEFEEFSSLALSEDDVASVAVVGLDGAFSILRFVFAIVAAKAARPVSVSNIVRIDAPTGLHIRKIVVGVDLLNKGDSADNAGIIGITASQERGDVCASLHNGFVRAAKGVNRVGFDKRQCAVQVAKSDGEVDGFTRRSVPMGRPIMAVHAVHLADFVLADFVGKLRFTEDSDCSSGIS